MIDGATPYISVSGNGWESPSSVSVLEYPPELYSAEYSLTDYSEQISQIVSNTDLPPVEDIINGYSQGIVLGFAFAMLPMLLKLVLHGILKIFRKELNP